MPRKTPPTPPSPSAALRRSPRQARAEQTVELIFETTAQVLREEGEAALTTNRIAERAGVSIGTLYQYFDDKEAIVRALLSRTRVRMMKQLDEVMAGADRELSDPRELVRAYVRLYVSAFGTGARNQRELVRLAWRMDRPDNVVLSLREAAERLSVHLERLNHPDVRPPTPAMVFVLTRALAGIVRSASLEATPLLGTQAFEDELVRVCWGVLRAGE
jgi:AcrR family transcriptional regulator